MSGSNDSGHNGGSAGDTIDNCLDLYEVTILNSPKPDVIEQIRKDDILLVELTTASPPSVVALKDDQIAGSITIRSIAKLIECIENGTSYVAVVLDIDGGRCRVQVRPETTL